jgi:hypothetical protein
MKPRDLEVMFAAPIFLFLGLFLFFLSLGSIFETMSSTPNHLLVGCLLFVLSFNCARIGVHLIRK